ncbi:MAG: hypothetical protein QNJ40_16240 [Xanthomonadales bacterium]|nr:hypothetical protein [Xanthomonadales bacterium]
MNRGILVLLLLTGHAFADEMYVFPANGQSAEQQEKDEFECHQWAAEKSRFDPVTGTSSAAGSQAENGTGTYSSSGGAGKAALGGATKGALIAEVSDGDTGKGAATGAAMGVFKGKRQRKAREEQHKTAADAARAEAAANDRANYMRANAACLEGRGYTVR